MTRPSNRSDDHPGRGQAGLPLRQAGFTLIELIIIILIIGLLSFYAMPRFDYRGAQVSALTLKLIEDLRYAQNRAMTTQNGHGIIFANCGGGSCLRYTVFENDDPGDPAPDPLTGQDMVVEMTGQYGGIGMTTTLTADTVQFDASGSPVGLTAAANTIDIVAGAFCTQLTITLATGLVSQGVC